MAKLLLLSIILLSIAVPIAAAGARIPALALRRAVWWMVAGITVYVLGVAFVFPRLMTG